MNRKRVYLAFALTALVMLAGCEKKEEKKTETPVKVQEYRSQMERDIEAIQQEEYDTLQFKETSFEEFPECSEVYILQSEDRGVTVEESIQSIKEWLKEIGQEDLNLKKQLRDAANGTDDDSKEYPYNYPGVYENRDTLANGDFFFVNTRDCYWQMGSDGAYSVSDGTINRYLQETSKAAMDALGVNEEKIVSESKIDADSDDAYELIDGETKICDARNMAVQYFAAGTPFAISEDISIDIPYAEVFQIKDKYGYIFDVCRSYKGIPIAYSDALARTEYDDISIREDCKKAYVATSGTVNAFTGHNEAQPFSEQEKTDQITRLRDSAPRLDQELAANLTVQVEQVAFVYCPICTSQEEDQNTLYPCWQYSGRNILNGRGVRIYHNAVSGEIYLYEYDLSET